MMTKDTILSLIADSPYGLTEAELASKMGASYDKIHNSVKRLKKNSKLFIAATGRLVTISHALTTEGKRTLRATRARQLIGLPAYGNARVKLVRGTSVIIDPQA